MFIVYCLVRLQVTIGGRMRIRAVIGQDNRLRVLQFGEHFRLKSEVALEVIRLARAQGCLVRRRPAGQDAHARILPVLRDGIARFELLLFPAEVARSPRAEVI